MSASSDHSAMKSVRSTRPISRNASASSCWRGYLIINLQQEVRGIDAQPDVEAIWPVLAAAGATLLGGAALAAVSSGVVLGREHQWQSVATRITGSWITACAILYFTLLLTRPHQ
jgi:hypothetical protein